LDVMAFHKYLGDSKMFEYDKHYRDCQQQNKPFIKAKINPAHGNYHVQLDLMTCNYKLSDDMMEQISKSVQDEVNYVESNLKYIFKDFSIDKELAWFDGVPSEHVDAFCNFLYDLTQKNSI
jgi:hypothetical protein